MWWPCSVTIPFMNRRWEGTKRKQVLAQRKWYLPATWRIMWCFPCGWHRSVFFSTLVLTELGAGAAGSWRCVLGMNGLETLYWNIWWVIRMGQEQWASQTTGLVSPKAPLATAGGLRSADPACWGTVCRMPLSSFDVIDPSPPGHQNPWMLESLI